MEPTRAIPIIGTAIAALTSAATGLSAEEGRAVRESAREIPVAYDVEVVVLGGGTGAVSVAAAEAGARVFLAAPYLQRAKDPSIIPQVRVVWLGSNYPKRGEYNKGNDVGSLNYILETEVECEIATVRYGQPSGTDAVRAAQ